MSLCFTLLFLGERDGDWWGNMRASGLCLDIMWALGFSTMCFLVQTLGTMFFGARLLVECYIHTNQSSIEQQQQH